MAMHASVYLGCTCMYFIVCVSVMGLAEIETMLESNTMSQCRVPILQYTDCSSDRPEYIFFGFVLRKLL